MKKFLGCFSLLLLISCLDEQKVEPATPSTYVRYINGGQHETAKAMEKTSDGGYIILANTSIENPSTPVIQNTIRIKLVKVNAYGSVEWSAILPSDANTSLNYVGNGISISAGGYIVSGEVIQKSDPNNPNAIIGKSNLLILDTNAEGVQLHSFSIDLPKASGTGVNVSGQAATELGPNRLLVLGSITGHPQNMILAEINTTAATATVTWDWTYGNGPTTVVNKLFLDNSQDVIFGGTVTRNNNFTDLRLIKAVQNSQGTDFDLNFGDPDLSEEVNGMCRTANGFAMIGSSSVVGKQDRDILFSRFSETGALLFSRTYPVVFPDTDTDVNQDEKGNAVCTTSDNGFIMLATIVSSTTTVDDQTITIGRGEKDYYLIKANAFGDVEWKHAFGSKRDDTGVCVTQAEDGGYVILGTTMLANLATIALIKTNSRGEIE